MQLTGKNSRGTFVILDFRDWHILFSYKDPVAAYNKNTQEMYVVADELTESSNIMVKTFFRHIVKYKLDGSMTEPTLVPSEAFEEMVTGEFV